MKIEAQDDQHRMKNERDQGHSAFILEPCKL